MSIARFFVMNASLFAILLIAGPAKGQAVFGVSDSAGPVVATGHQELTGPVAFTVLSGTTVPGTIEMALPLPIANDLVTGVTVTGIGGLVGAGVAVFNPDAGVLRASVPAGGGPGDYILVSGLRISVPGADAANLEALVSATGNAITSGQNRARLVTTVVPPFTVDPTSDNVFTVNTAGIVQDPLDEIVLTEGGPGAFTSDVFLLGQTVPTQLIFRVDGIPDNLEVSFPAAVMASNTPATFTTTSGLPEVRTNMSPTDTVTYHFAAAGSSATTVESFEFNIDIVAVGTLGVGTGFIQVSLGPIGAAEPNAIFPSTDIPRYEALFAPDAPGVEQQTRHLFFPIASDAADQVVAITNTGSGGAFVTFRAIDPDGNLVTGDGINGQSFTSIPANRTITRDLGQMFGAVTPVDVSVIEIESDNERVIASSWLEENGVRLGMSSTTQRTEAVIPFFRGDASEDPEIIVFNVDTPMAKDVTLTVYSDFGQVMATANHSIAEDGSLREPLSTAVSVLPGELPLRGYVVVKASLDGVRSSLVTEWNDHAIVVPGQLAFGRDRFEYPFFVFGAGYETVLNLINTASQRVARVTVTPLAPDGAVLGGAVPEVFEIPPQEMFDLDFRSAFGTDTGLRTGSFSVAIDRSDVGPFGSIPRIVGTILLSTADSTSVAPLLGDTVMETFFVPTAELVNTYTGLAVYNDGTAAATVEVQAINADGVLMGSATYAVAPKRLDSRLLREIVPESLGHQDGSVRIVTTSPQVRVVAFQGRLDTGELLRLNQSVVP